MSTTPSGAVVATRRFGLGARPGEVSEAAADPRGYVVRQIGVTPVQGAADLQSSDQIIQRRLRAGQELKALAGQQSGSDLSDDANYQALRQIVRPAAYVQPEVSERFEAGFSSDNPLIERLTYFWSDHFTVSRLKGSKVTAVAGAFEREAIRPYVYGRFSDMVLAVAKHPAMLFYLDNDISAGPDSRVGQRKSRGLNENLGREILELHTLGVQGGYTQADVIAFAKALTGWRGEMAPGDATGRFVFVPQWHEPGPVEFMGQVYDQPGMEQAEAILNYVSVHPATARHIAGELAAHFLQSPPPPALVDRLSGVFLESDGDLAAVTRALVTDDASWQAPPSKVLPPFDFVVAVLRALELPPSELPVEAAAALFGQRTWGATSPKGWPAEDEIWASPAALLKRLDWVETVVPRAGDVDPLARADAVLGDLSEPTRNAVARAESRHQALALLLMSPEFLLR